MYPRRKSLSPIKGVTEPALKELLKNLEKEQTNTLRKAIESRGEHQTSCITHCRENNNAELVESARILTAKSFRWKSLAGHEHNLIKLPWCSLDNCINPFHFARDNRLTHDEIDLNATPEVLEDEPKQTQFCYEAGVDNLIGSNPDCLSDMTPVRNLDGRWALCMFWEEKTRIGRTIAISSRYFSVFGSLVDENGLCLRSLPQNEKSGRIRDKVGGGITIWKSNHYIWIYNRDNTCSSFVHTNKIGEDPIKLSCGSCLPLPQESRCITISLIKGWGKHYRRQEVTDCPAWLEIVLDQ